MEKKEAIAPLKTEVQEQIIACISFSLQTKS